VKQLTFIICTGGPKDPLSRQNWALAQSLVAVGHRVSLVIYGQRHDVVGSWSGCSVLTWPSPRPLYWRDAYFFWKLLGRLQPDAVLANFDSLYIAMITSYLRGVPCRVAWYRNLTGQARLDAGRSAWKQRLVERAKSLTYRLATHVVPVSKVAQVDVSSSYGVPAEKCRIFHTCRADPLEVLRKRSIEKTNSMRIICVGRLYPSKGQDVLIKAVKELIDLEPGWDLEVELVGDGPEKELYQQLVVELGLEECIRFVGSVEHAEALRRIAMASVMVVPFRTDPGPGVIAEGLGLGVPLVVAASGAIPELLGGSEAGLFVPPEDPKALAHALRRVLGDSDLRSSMALSARELFLSKFDLRYWVREVGSWLEEIAAVKHG
jgi:glycosyltransferase involved in cell wall biosynthesis